MTDDSADIPGGLAEAAAEYLGIDLERYPSRRRERLIAAWRDAQGDPHEALRAALCVGETMFLRHPEHFRALRGVVAGLPGYGRDGVRAWSAGCATGEEAYSLAATLRAACGDHLHVIGSDVRRDFLAHASKGRFGPWSLRGVDLPAQAAWLAEDGAGARVEVGVRRLVKFLEVNLKRGLYPTDLDVIFCRNVLLYFHVDEARRVLREMADAVRPGGVLFVGYQDPRPTPEDGWRAERQGEVEYFRRPPLGAESTAPPGPHGASGTSAPPALPADPPLRPRTSAPPSRSPPPEAPAPDPPSTTDLDDGLAAARSQAAAGDVNGALDHLERLMEGYPDSVAPCVLAALLAEEAGDAQLVVRYSRRACFLSPRAVIPNLMMGFGLDALGQPAQARKYFRLASTAVAKVEDRSDALPDGEGLTARQVERMLDGRDE